MNGIIFKKISSLRTDALTHFSYLITPIKVKNSTLSYQQL